MTTPKNSSKTQSSVTQSSIKTQKSENINPDDWTFDVKVTTDSEGELQEVRKPVKRSVVAEAKEERERKKRETLVLEDAPKESLTRAQMAARLKKEERTDDVFTYANPIKRLLAFILDLIVVGGVTYVARFLLAPAYALTLLALERYNYQLDISKGEYYYYGQFVVLGIVYFFFMVIGTSFYNRSPGKKFLGLMVRNDKKFSLHITDMFVREFVMKPISILTVVGILMALFHKKRKTFHDLSMKTLVIEG